MSSDGDRPAQPPNTALTVPARRHLTNHERAAVILALMEPSAASRIANEFDDGRIDNAIASFRRLSVVPPRDLVDTVDRFNRALKTDLPIIAGGSKRASALATTLAPPPVDVVHLETGSESSGSIEAGADADEVWAYVGHLSPADTVKLLKNERAAMIAAVLRRIPRANAAAVLGAIPDEHASKVLRLLMGDTSPTERTYDAVAETLRRQAPSRLTEVTAETAKDIRKAAGILNAVPARRQDTLLSRIAVDDPQTAERLQEHVLRFGTLQERLPKTIVPTLFREVDEQTLDTALSHALAHERETADFLLGCISQRLAEMIRDRIEERASVRAEDGEAAQTEIMQTLITWSESDRFAFRPLPEKDQQ